MKRTARNLSDEVIYFHSFSFRDLLYLSHSTIHHMLFGNKLQPQY